MRAEQRLARLCWVLLLSSLCAYAHAETFEPADPGAESLQTRTFAASDARELLRAALSVLQDLKFFVTNASLTPGLITATPPACRDDCHSAALTVTADVVGPNAVQVRVSLGRLGRPRSWQGGEPDSGRFNQNFFTHLDRALTRQRYTR